MSGASVLTLPAPGWYQDPAGVAAYRWWDGVDWTAGTHDGSAPAAPVQPVAVAMPAEPVGFATLADRGAFEPVAFESAVFEPAAPRVPVPSAPAAEPATASAAPAASAVPAAPAAPAARPAPAVRRGVSAAKTRWSTILTAYPFVYPFAVGTIVGLAYAGGSSTNPSTLALIAGATAFVLLLPTFLLAERDRKELAVRGYQPTPSTAWLLLLPPIAYLIARRRLVGPA